MGNLVWLLLPVSGMIGWYIAKYQERRHSMKNTECGTAYYKSINYLLNEQPDKAIEVFIEMLEVDSETVETHLALGNLFRRRGEVDRAIRVHQNLIARPKLSQDQRTQALLELGQDYMKAGLFDRAESLFLELIDLNAYSESALTYLVAIYQQEREWGKAISTAENLQDHSKDSMKVEIAQFYCELAQEEIDEQQIPRAEALLKQAMTYDNKCVRASIMLGTLWMEKAEFSHAIEQFSEVHKQDSDFCPHVLPKLKTCHEHVDGVKSMMAYLENILKEHYSVSLMLMLSELIQKEESEKKAIEFLASQLRIHPSIQGLEQLVVFSLNDAKAGEHETLVILRDLIQKLLDNRPKYQCQSCGFEGKSLHWQCPRCKSWAQIKPIRMPSNVY